MWPGHHLLEDQGGPGEGQGLEQGLWHQGRAEHGPVEGQGFHDVILRRGSHGGVRRRHALVDDRGTQNWRERLGVESGGSAPHPVYMTVHLLDAGGTRYVSGKGRRSRLGATIDQQILNWHASSPSTDTVSEIQRLWTLSREARLVRKGNRAYGSTT